MCFSVIGEIELTSAFVMATLVSRVTGFGRVLALVAALGLGTRLMDAYTAPKEPRP